MAQFAAMFTPLRIAVVLTVLALGWRMVHVTEWPFPYATAVQYDCALSARAIWLAADPGERTGEKAIWFDAVGFDHIIGPPILSGLAAGCYCIVGEEIPWIAKAFGSLFWVAAGWFIFLAVERQTGCRWAALVAFTWFNFTPFGLIMSRCFQPEPLLACGFAIAVWHLARPGRTLTWRETLLAGVVCGLCAFPKPGILFGPLAAAFAAIILQRSTPGTLARKVVHIAAFTVLLVAPSFAYVALVLPHRGGELLPGLLLEAWYYQGVEKLIAHVIGYPALALGLFGASLAVRAGDRLLVGLLAGYVGYLGIFTYHCATHEYYHLPLLVPVALGLGWVAVRLGQTLEPLGKSRPRQVLLAAFAVIAFAGYLRGTRQYYLGPWRFTPIMQTVLADLAAKRQARDANYRVVREAVGPGAKVIAMTEDYGYPLEMEAWLRVAFWPPHYDIPIMVRAGLMPAGFTHDAHVAKLSADGCEFAVITDFVEFAAQPELQASLEKRGRLIVNTPTLRVYDLRR